MKTLKLSQIRIDGGTEPRAQIDKATLTDYVNRLRSGAAFPPVTVFFDGVSYWLADGFHRYHAHRKVGQKTIGADIREGSLRDAILHSVGANSEHGLRRTNEDKRRAVMTMLTNPIVSADEDGISWSNRAIAMQCRVSEKMVRIYRKALAAKNPILSARAQVAYVNRFGKKGTMNTANIGKSALATLKPFRGPALIKLPYDSAVAATAIVDAMGEVLSAEIANQILTLTRRRRAVV